MNVLATGREDRPFRPVLFMTARFLGTALTAAMGLIHAWLWFQGYREIPVIGTLFFIVAKLPA